MNYFNHTFRPIAVQMFGIILSTTLLGCSNPLFKSNPYSFMDKDFQKVQELLINNDSWKIDCICDNRDKTGETYDAEICYKIDRKFLGKTRRISVLKTLHVKMSSYYYRLFRLSCG